MSDENIIRGCGCSPDEACNLCGFEACQLAWIEITHLKKLLKEGVKNIEGWREDLDSIIRMSYPDDFGLCSVNANVLRKRLETVKEEIRKRDKLLLEAVPWVEDGIFEGFTWKEDAEKWLEEVGRMK